MKKRFTPEQLADIAYVSELSVSPDGKYSAFTRYTADTANNIFSPAVYVLDHTAGTEKKICSFPAYRPEYTEDGVYFLSDVSGENQVWLWDGRNTLQRTHLRHGVLGYAVSPDGCIAVEAPLWLNEENLYALEMTRQEKDAWMKKRTYAPVYIDDFIYKLDSAYGVLDESIRRIAVVEPDGKTHLVSTPGMQCSLPVWSPDGKQLAYFGKPYSGTEAEENELFLVKAGYMSQLTSHMDVCSDGPACFTGGGLVFTAYKRHENGGCSEWLYLVEGGEIHPLFSENEPEICQGVNCTPIGRSVYGMDGPYYRPAGESLSCWRGDERLFRVKTDGTGKTECVETGEISVHAFCVRYDGSVVFIGGDRENPADIYVYDGSLRRLTDSNRWLSEYELAPVHRMKLPYDGGEADVWIMEPCGRIPGKRYPAVLDIHGGPECTYVDDFWHEFRALSAAGLAVIYCNPRGSAGYGRKNTGGQPYGG